MSQTQSMPARFRRVKVQEADIRLAREAGSESHKVRLIDLRMSGKS